MKTLSTPCVLCASTNFEHWYQGQHGAIENRDYFACLECGLVQVPAEQQPGASEEQAIYELHQNNPQDPGYRRFLNRAFEPVVTRLKPGASGLDFGSGPGPALSLMFEEAGFSCANYDIYYANEPARLHQDYDFITATEVFEHLSQPAQALDTLCQCLKPGGLLMIMTQRATSKAEFVSWRYIHDPTHISLFSDKSMDYISQRWPLHELERRRDTVLWQKPRG
ncbi:methyltransferase [Aliidiomarina sedimenti]|uniref:Methyltransferase n=1 Tax=Aliidiomarina sedimenti TaxID=1933879 RepID=A0ABY0BY28_9GAMM|nr:class I SAM-dependent methyltransferase [Aliidiomarina sedimenti]RUO29166.1 methyltransferase [Aliidiomarina sedimenti]